MPDRISHAIVLNLHQPPGNLLDLLETAEWEVNEILWAIDRIPRSLWQYQGRGRVHLAMSGTLLETLSDPAFQRRVYGTVDCGSMLWHLQNKDIVDVLGTGYYHPVLPLIPSADRVEHLVRWQGIGRHLFPDSRFDGFWPPEMAFSMELIPLLRRLGYRYVLVDSEHVEPVTPMSWQELRYRPHIARYGDDEIIVVVRDRELSDAQESGMDAGWFVHEVYERTRHCAFEPLVVTCTDGDNGGWFRNTNAKANFWNVFYDQLMYRLDCGNTSGVQPALIHEYLDRCGPAGEVTVRTGAWNTGWHHGTGFTQWTGSGAQRAALARVAAVSDLVRAGGAGEVALWRLLRAQTSCNFYWGEAWVDRCHNDLDAALLELVAE